MNLQFIRDKRVIAIAVVLVAVVMIVAVAVKFRGRLPEVRQADGTVLRLEKVSFGLREPFKPGGWFGRTKEMVAKRLPKSWADRIVAPATTNKTAWNRNFFNGPHTNEPALQVWLTRINPVTGKYENVDVRSAEVVDADGCVMGAITGGGEDQGLLAPLANAAARPGPRSGSPATASPSTTTVVGTGPTGPFTQRSSVTWFSFEVFPRREKELKLRFYDGQRTLMGEFIVPNPAPPTPLPTAPAPTIPVMVTNGDAVFTLTTAELRNPSIGLASSPSTVIPKPRQTFFTFKGVQTDATKPDWDAMGMELWDSAGNHAPKSGEYPFALCTKDPEWRLQVMFATRNEDANLSWKLRGLAVPGRDSKLEFATNTVLDNVPIKMVALGGTGRNSFSQKVSDAGTSRGSSSSSSGLRLTTSRQQGVANYDITSPNPYAAVMLGEIGTNRLVSVRAIDEGGRRYPGKVQLGSGIRVTGPLTGPGYVVRGGDFEYLRAPVPSPSGRGLALRRDEVTFVFFDLPANVKTIDLLFEVHRMQPVEFQFKPPGN